MLTRLLDGEVESLGADGAEAIYGVNDGIVATFAVVSGVANGVGTPSGVV